MKTNPNSPAHPTIWDDAHEPSFQRDNDGMTKLETIAIAAMQGILANSSLRTKDPDIIARDSVISAKALIKELNKED